MQKIRKKAAVSLSLVFTIATVGHWSIDSPYKDASKSASERRSFPRISDDKEYRPSGHRSPVKPYTLPRMAASFCRYLELGLQMGLVWLGFGFSHIAARMWEECSHRNPTARTEQVRVYHTVYTT